MRINPIRRALAAGASVAVATVGLAAFAPTAQAANASLKFDCSASILSGQEFIFDADITVPASVEVGQKVKTTFSGTVTAPDSTRGAAYSFLNGRFLEGVANIDGKFGASAVSLTANLPKTAIPSVSGPMVLPTTGGGSFVADSIGTQNLTIDGFTAPLTMTKADDTTSPVNVTCTAKAADTVVASVEVTEAVPAQATKTTAKVKYAKKAQKATVSVKVLNKDKTAAAGKVKLTLKKGKKAVAKRTVKLNANGQAKAAFKKLNKKGKYTLVVQYQGTKTSKKSKRTVKFRVR